MLERSPQTLPSNIPSLILKVLDCPWVSSSLPSLTGKERREARVRPPLPADDAVVYRSSGCLLESHDGTTSKAGWGAARWSADSVLAERAAGSLPQGSTSNIAKYAGLRAVFQKAVQRRDLDKHVVFELDSLLLVRQVQPYGTGRYACRSPCLQPLFLQCIQCGRELDEAEVHWQIRHVYSEYNLVANGLARRAVAAGDSAWR